MIGHPQPLVADPITEQPTDAVSQVQPAKRGEIGHHDAGGSEHDHDHQANFHRRNEGHRHEQRVQHRSRHVPKTVASSPSKVYTSSGSGFGSGIPGEPGRFNARLYACKTAGRNQVSANRTFPTRTPGRRIFTSQALCYARHTQQTSVLPASEMQWRRMLAVFMSSSMSK